MSPPGPASLRQTAQGARGIDPPPDQGGHYPGKLGRRQFLRVTALGAGGWLATGDTLGAETAAASVSASAASSVTAADLPQGSAPLPVPLPHFPSRLHAFVWRNWQLVPAERMAHVLGTTATRVRRLGEDMSLGPAPRITRDLQRRSALTIIRRNWHLLPYDQLLALLGWTAAQMAYTLREDDFFYVKLGSLKPRCPPLRWVASDANTREHERQIARWVRQDFGGPIAGPEDPLFSFVPRLSAPPALAVPAPAPAPEQEPLRFCYSYFALYGDPLLEPEADPYPDGYLARLAACGVTGVWLQAVLYKLAPFPWQPELSDRREERLRNLRRLVDRARRHGVRVLLYLNEPRAMPLRFFGTHPALKGVVEGDYAALCTSTLAVRQFLVEAVASICRTAPGLGGFFTITASENLSNCWSHHRGAGCPRCGRRPPADVIAEANAALAEGIHLAKSTARLIVWDWGWDDAWAADIIRQLPKDARLMSVSEWSLPIERGGVKSEVGEYSISAIGPGPRAGRHWALARQHGLQTVAKVQAGNTWELASVPYIPAVENVARHAANLATAGVNGLMLSWTLGGYPSPNLEAVAEGMLTGSPATALQRVARRRFGPALGPAVVEAWRGFSAAFSAFPYHGGVLYQGPQQLGPANLLWAEPTGYASSMTGFPYDDLDGWRAIYPPEVFATQFEQVASGFDRALADLRTAVEHHRAAATRAQRQTLAAEMSVAETAAIHFRSVAIQTRFILARRALASARESSEAKPILETLERLLVHELNLARRLYALQSRDSRLGFEAANQYFYVPLDLVEAAINCHALRERWLPEQKRRWAGPLR